MEPIDIRYIAGLIDADGYLSLSTCKRTGRSTVIRPTFSLTVHRMDRPVIEEIHNWFATQGVALSLYEVGGSGKGSGRTYIRLTSVSGLQCERLCTMLLPYLRIKRGQAERILEFAHSRTGRGSQQHYTPRDFELVEECKRLPQMKAHINSLHQLSAT